jgi:hypothetical protein
LETIDRFSSADLFFQTAVTEIVENKRDVSISANSSCSNAEASFYTPGRTGTLAGGTAS